MIYATAVRICALIVFSGITNQVMAQNLRDAVESVKVMAPTSAHSTQRPGLSGFETANITEYNSFDLSQAKDSIAIGSSDTLEINLSVAHDHLFIFYPNCKPQAASKTAFYTPPSNMMIEPTALDDEFEIYRYNLKNLFPCAVNGFSIGLNADAQASERISFKVLRRIK